MITRLIALPALLLVAGLLAACGGDDGEPVVTTTADGTVIAELETKAGDAWTVTLSEGATEAYDLYGNDGREPIAIWGEDAGAITTAVDERFAIGLPQQAGTGYAWRPLDDTASDSVVELLQQGVNPHDPGPEVGGEETHYYVYRATAAGTGRIEFGLYGPGADEPERTAVFDITVS